MFHDDVRNDDCDDHDFDSNGSRSTVKDTIALLDGALVYISLDPEIVWGTFHIFFSLKLQKTN